MRLSDQNREALKSLWAQCLGPYMGIAMAKDISPEQLGQLRRALQEMALDVQVLEGVALGEAQQEQARLAGMARLAEHEDEWLTRAKVWFRVAPDSWQSRLQELMVKELGVTWEEAESWVSSVYEEVVPPEPVPEPSPVHKPEPDQPRHSIGVVQQEENSVWVAPCSCGYKGLGLYKEVAIAQWTQHANKLS